MFCLVHPGIKIIYPHPPYFRNNFPPGKKEVTLGPCSKSEFPSSILVLHYEKIVNSRCNMLGHALHSAVANKSSSTIDVFKF